LDSERGQGRGLRIAELLDTWARVSKQQHAVDRYIVNDGGSINDCGDAMRPPPYPVFPGSSTSTTESLRRQGRGSRAPAELSRRCKTSIRSAMRSPRYRKAELLWRPPTIRCL